MGSLLVVQGDDADLGRQIVCTDPITIGRGEEAELTLNDASISRVHCAVESDEETGHYVLIDLNSMNGTMVNNFQVSGRYPLSTGDKIFLGASVIRFSLSDAVDLEYQTKVNHLVYTDPLTGLGSRRHYDVVFEATCKRAQMDRTSLTLMVIDMDGLKQINDAHGHEAGGFCITATSRVIREVLGPHGSLHRFGGDEFVGVFPGMEIDRAQQLAESLRRQVENREIAFQNQIHRPTLSIGIANYPQDVADPKGLFGAADRALYKAKEDGRNRVEIAEHCD